MIGQTISHYRILEKLGEGGMGVVYKAEDTKLKRAVALKFLPAHLLESDENKARFIREARAAASLSHPNICTIYEFDEFDGQAFIAMEYLEGLSLKQKVASGPLPLAEILDIASQVAEGLQKAHAEGITHRDIKPANVMITTDGQAKILDFGLAISPGATRVTRIGTMLGTIAYMSPEQAQARAVDRRTDIWSTGVMLYEMVTGKPPFQADHEQATIHLILNEEPPRVRSHRADTPKQLEGIIEKCLSKDTGERYENAEALKTDLESIIQSQRPGTARTKISVQKSKPSIAVLPFRDMSSQRDQEYFCEGIAEELINALVKLEGLRVAARTSTFQFRDRDSDIKKIGEKLQVGTVLEGSIRKSGNRLRITAQLINVEDGFHLWSEKYDRELQDIFAIQDEISLAIVDKLKVRLLGEERSALVKRHTANQEAHNLYLKGLYFWNRRLEGGMKLAMKHFHQAIEKDPGYALAHVGIADTYNITGLFSYLPPKETFPKAIAAAKKALEIDETLGEAHASLAFAATLYDWDWSKAEKEFRRAIELNPNYATAHEWYAIYLFAMGRFDESIIEAKRARDLDPLSIIIHSVVGIAYYYARRYDESITSHLKALEMDRNFLLANTYITLPYVANGMYDEALETVRDAEPMAAEDAFSLGFFGLTYGLCGQKEDALRLLDILSKLAKKRYVSPMHRANVVLGLGRRDEGLDLLEEAYQERNPLMALSKTAPEHDSLRFNPRFQALLKKIGFEE
jgi:serine/threonine protein kinase/Tfp pilus assembly protein PilF